MNTWHYSIKKKYIGENTIKWKYAITLLSDFFEQFRVEQNAGWKMIIINSLNTLWMNATYQLCCLTNQTLKISVKELISNGARVFILNENIECNAKLKNWKNFSLRFEAFNKCPHLFTTRSQSSNRTWCRCTADNSVDDVV